LKKLGTLIVLPVLPARIARLTELAYNLWWSWNPGAQALFSALDNRLWDRVHHNPVRFLRWIDQSHLDRAASGSEYVERYEAVLASFDAYMTARDTWFSRSYPSMVGKTIAYFSAEFGLHESLPIYSGGLGILAGDICKAASDLGVPLVGVGFLYGQGYFRQQIDNQGRQEAYYDALDFPSLPLKLAKDGNGNDVVVTVSLPERDVALRVWQAQVGRVPLYLLDADVEANRPQDRGLTARLYGGDEETRLAQEIVLGLGGVRALRALGINPSVWHMNEGHSAFLTLERLRELVGQGYSFDVAREIVAADSTFTTHTPVPAGNDAFHFDLISRYFDRFWPQLGLDRESFLALAKQDLPWGAFYSMTVLAMRLASTRNGVSRLHGETTRKMWSFLWPEVAPDEAPIISITNGVHTETWLGPEMVALYDRYLPFDWRDRMDDVSVWQGVYAIPDEELWEARRDARLRCLRFIRERVKAERLRRGEPTSAVEEADSLLNPEALTIGFARRFATYKRATLILSDLPRLQRLLNQPDRPVQIIFAGKAHPADEPGKALIQRVVQIAKDPEFQGKIVFIEDYDMEVARNLVQGVDLWLNTPRRPMEASGTSGLKAGLNGVPSASILDGWWKEAYNGTNGWAIGDDREYPDQEAGDLADARSLYDLLEHEIVPAFYTRDERSLPVSWLQVMRAAIASIAPAFAARRVVKEYVEQMYAPAAERAALLSENGGEVARSLTEWKALIKREWANVHVEASVTADGPITLGTPVPLRAKVHLGSIEPSQVAVEVVYARAMNGSQEHTDSAPLEWNGKTEDGDHIYSGSFIPRYNGTIIYGVRVRPINGYLNNQFEMGLARWA